MSYVEFLEFSIPHLTVLTALLWARKQILRKGWVTHEQLEETLSNVRAILIVVAVVAFSVYYILIPHPPW